MRCGGGGLCVCVYACLCEGMEGMDEGLGGRRLCAKVNKSLKSPLTWTVCSSVFCTCACVCEPLHTKLSHVACVLFSVLYARVCVCVLVHTVTACTYRTLQSLNCILMGHYSTDIFWRMPYRFKENQELHSVKHYSYCYAAYQENNG